MTSFELWLEIHSIPGEDDLYATLPLRNASALVGRNGAGKSRLLETIKSVLLAGNRWLGRPGQESGFSTILIAPCPFEVDQWWSWVRDILLFAEDAHRVRIGSSDLGADPIVVTPSTSYVEFSQQVIEIHQTAYGVSKTLEFFMEHPYLGLGFGYFTQMSGGHPGLFVSQPAFLPNWLDVLPEEAFGSDRFSSTVARAAGGDPSMLAMFDILDDLFFDPRRTDASSALPPGIPHVLFAGTGDYHDIELRLGTYISGKSHTASRGWWRANGQGFVLDERVTSAAEELARSADRLAPAFVVDHGPIKVEFNPNWPGPRLGVQLPSGFVPHDSLGAGVDRWVCIAVDAAMTFASLPPEAPKMFLVDEPEAHLHPAAIADVVDWTRSRLGEGDAVIVATHSAQVLASPTIDELIHVKRVSGRLSTEVIPCSLSNIAEISEVSGFRNRDILNAWAGVLLVEGLHDQQVIEHFFGESLDGELIVVQPLRGSKHVTKVFEVELLEKLDIPAVVLLDDVRRSVMAGGEAPVTAEEKKALRLLRDYQEAREQRQLPPLHVLSFPLPDIWCALPERAVRMAFPKAKFGGWEPVVEAWKVVPETPAGGFKSWFLTRLGEKVATDEFVPRVLAASKGDRPSEHLSDAIDTAIEQVNQLGRSSEL